MNIRLRNFFVFLILAIATFLTRFLWDLPPAESVFSVIVLLVTAIFGLATLHWFIKIIWPKYDLGRLFNDLLGGL